jgi:enediyne biosynthesis protein E5
VPRLQMPKPADPRVSALRRFAVSITVLTVVGHLLLGFETSWAQQVVAVGTSLGLTLALEGIDALATRRRPEFARGRGELVTFLLPAYISGMAIGLLLYSSTLLWPFAFAATVSAGSKYLFRAPVNGRMRHFMNPSNLGLATTLALFPHVGVGIPYMFTETTAGALDWIIPGLLLASGLMLNLTLTGKGPLVAAWLGGFALQAAVRHLLTGVAFVAALSPMTGTAFLLFTNYMITDPGTSPRRPRSQVVFALVAATFYGLIIEAHLVYGLFFCVVATCALRGALLWGIALRDARRRVGSVTVPRRVPVPTTAEPIA